MRIVLDTNIIFRDWFLRSPEMEFLRSRSRDLSIHFYVPKIVFEETVRNYRAQIEKRVRASEARLAELNGLLIDKVRVEFKVSDWTNQYRTFLADLVAKIGTAEHGWDSIGLDSLITRSLNRRKPFNNDDRGMRDAVLWETVLTNIANDIEATVLVTANSNDFSDKETGLLHQDLRQDLADRGLANDCVEVYSDLRTLISNRIEPAQKSLAQQIESMKEDAIGFVGNWFSEGHGEVREFLSDELREEFTGWVFANGLSVEELTDPTLGSIVELARVELQYISEIDIDQIYIEFLTILGVEIDSLVEKGAPNRWMDQGKLTILNRDWSDRYASASTKVYIPMELSVLYNTDTFQIVSESHEFVEFLGSCGVCDHPIISETETKCSNCGATLPVA